jgi:hypothetical protein
MHVEVIQEVANDDGLCFQHCRWHWDNDTPSEGYRFIWRDDAGNLKPSRGQAWIPNGAIMFDLISKAMSAGWLR